MNRALVIAEHLQGKLNPSTAKCVSCAQGIGEAEIDIAVLAADAGRWRRRPRRSPVCGAC
jgi:electron transfer flavoprotein alpha subunit